MAFPSFPFQVVASAIVDKYIGESARVVREMFGYAKVGSGEGRGFNGADGFCSMKNGASGSLGVVE